MGKATVTSHSGEVTLWKVSIYAVVISLRHRHDICSVWLHLLFSIWHETGLFTTTTNWSFKWLPWNAFTCVHVLALLWWNPTHLALRPLLFGPFPPLERCYLIPSSWKDESCAALSAPARCHQASGVIGWPVADSAAIGSVVGRPACPVRL